MHTPFKPVLFFKRLGVLGFLVLGAASAHAHNDDRSFEDRLNNSWDKPQPSIYVDRHGGRGWGHVEHNWHFKIRHHDWSGWGGHGSGSGNGGIGGVSPIPEPGSELMLLAGLAMVAALVRRKSR